MKKIPYKTDQNNPAVKEYVKAVKKGFPKNWVPTLLSEEQTKRIKNKWVTAKDGTVLPPSEAIRDAIKDKIIERQKMEIAKLKADLAYAVGYAHVLGHPIEYLEKRYPEFTEALGK